jgi:hypothetical protein
MVDGLYAARPRLNIHFSIATRLMASDGVTSTRDSRARQRRLSFSVGTRGIASVGCSALNNAASDNARRLAEDAQALFDRGSSATAASLAMLAVEEAGKVSILRTLLTAKSDNDLREEWKRYRRHTEKNQFLLMYEHVQGGRAKALGLPRTVH